MRRLIIMFPSFPTKMINSLALCHSENPDLFLKIFLGRRKLKQDLAEVVKEEEEEVSVCCC